MKKSANNYAFIDSQNVYRGIQALGWEVDWICFRIYLEEKYSVLVAYLFIGFIPEHNDLYTELQQAGFILKFKPVLPNGQNGVKGNVDADMVLQVMLDCEKFDQAVIITSDGDFYSLVRHLYDTNKLLVVLSPNIKTCSVLLKKTAKERIIYMNNLKNRIGKKKNTA